MIAAKWRMERQLWMDHMIHRVASGCVKSFGNQHGEPMDAIRARDRPDRRLKDWPSALRRSRH
jgi:hypothetical protein